MLSVRSQKRINDMKSRFLILAVAVVAAVSCADGRKPLVGITTGWSSERITVKDTYVCAVREAGGIPVILPPVRSASEAEEALRSVRAVVFTGGEDIDPVRYGEEVLNESVEVNGPRDTSDFLLAVAALRMKKPVLAICRGEQLLNVALGGTLYQDLPVQAPGPVAHRQDAPASEATHIIHIEKESRLHSLTGVDSAMVNSFHHQAVKDPAPGTKVVARAADGIVEGFEKGDMICVQFHPEALVKAGDRTFLPLFEDLVRRARRD